MLTSSDSPSVKNENKPRNCWSQGELCANDEMPEIDGTQSTSMDVLGTPHSVRRSPVCLLYAAHHIVVLER